MIPDFEPNVLEAPRPELTDKLDRGISIERKLRSAFVAGPGAEQNLERLFSDDALCVTTGHQPGLFTGPLYTIYKALTAVALARWCERRLAQAVVPVFWVAGDDHDFAEANHYYLLSSENYVERVELRSRHADALSTPLYQETLGRDVDQVLRQFEDITRETEFRPSLVDTLKQHYVAEDDLATAFGGVLADLLGRFGLLVFHPTAAAAKQVAAKYVLGALRQAVELDEKLRARATALEQQNRPTPVTVHPGDTLVMIEGAAGRDRLVIDGSEFRTRRSGELWSLAAIEELAAGEPQRLSANVLLRPVIEAAMLPTVAYVGGPAEIAYLPQAEPVYRILGVKPQAAVPRWSARVVEARVRKTLDKYAVAVDDLLGEDGKLETRLVRESMPHEAEEALTALRQAVETEYPRLLQGAIAVDAALEKRVEAARNGVLNGLGDVEKRILSHLKKQNDVVVRQIASARNAVFPLGRPQERVYNVLQYLVRYGPDFLDGVLERCEAWIGDLEPASHTT